MRFISLFFIFSAFFSFTTAAGAVPAATTRSGAERGAGRSSGDRPNVIVILADDLGYADVGFHGCKDIPTPHIDALAREGVRFTSGYVSHPFCSPTRAGLLTGRYQQRFGHENNPIYEPENERLGLPTRETLLPALLQKTGYATGAIGKWHLGAAAPFHPNRRGFDEFFGFLGGGHDYFPQNSGMDAAVEYRSPILRNDKPVEEKQYLTHAFTREAVDFIGRHKDRPFFLYLAYNAPHTPLQAPADYLDRFRTIENAKRRTYAAMVSAMDDGIGRVMAALKQQGIERNTLVFFLSDNGGPTWANASSNQPLRGFKGDVFEGGVRVPFVARWTGRLPEGIAFEPPVSSLDLLPTALALAGIHAPEERPLDGINLMPFLLETTVGVPHPQLFWRTGGGQQFAVREGELKYLHNSTGRGGAFTGVVNLNADPAEQRNLLQEQPDAAEQLMRDWKQWNAGLIPPAWNSPREGASTKPRP